jgi:hypothetical protein
MMQHHHSGRVVQGLVRLPAACLRCFGTQRLHSRSAGKIRRHHRIPHVGDFSAAISIRTNGEAGRVVAAFECQRIEQRAVVAATEQAEGAGLKGDFPGLDIMDVDRVVITKAGNAAGERRRFGQVERATALKGRISDRNRAMQEKLGAVIDGEGADTGRVKAQLQRPTVVGGNGAIIDDRSAAGAGDQAIPIDAAAALHRQGAGPPVPP